MGVAANAAPARFEHDHVLHDELSAKETGASWLAAVRHQLGDGTTGVTYDDLLARAHAPKQVGEEGVGWRRHQENQCTMHPIVDANPIRE